MSAGLSLVKNKGKKLSYHFPTKLKINNFDNEQN